MPTHRELRVRTGRILRGSLTSDGVDPTDLRRVDLDELAAAAHMHRISGYVDCAVRGCGIDNVALRRAAHRDVGQHLRVRAALRTVARDLDGAGIPWVVVKGPVLSEHVHTWPARRGYTDLDLLVDARDLERAVEVLVAAGWRLLERNHALVRTRVPGELHLLSPNGILIDLHWTLINANRTRAAFRVPTEEVLERRALVEIGGSAVPTTDAADTLLHVALHAALSGGDRLLWLKDIEQILQNLAIDADVVVSRARAWGVEIALGVMLARTRRVLGTRLGDPIEDILAVPRWWRWMEASADGLSPVHGAASQPRFARMVARSSRPVAGSGSAEMLRRGAAAIERRVPGRRPSVHESVMHERPDPRQLAEYYEIVRRMSQGSTR